MQIRFWYTKGIQNWEDGEVSKMMDELKVNNVKPLLVLYCATASGRVSSAVLTKLLREFLEKEVPIFYVITNLYGHSVDQLKHQIDEALQIMTT